VSAQPASNKSSKGGIARRLAPVDQWFWCRRGIYGPWTYNRNSTIGQVTGEDVDEMRFVCREVERPVNRVALIAFVRKALSQKDWDGFIEAYGIPAVFIIMPPDVPEEKADEYLETASQVVGDARGALPNGSDIKTVDNGARGVNPFRDHLKYQDEQLVLRGTGGKLTMLAESGSGTLAGDAHSETFAAIARSEAKEISETLRLCIDKEILARVTPGEDAYAYFELSANEETEPAQLVKDIAQLENAGLETDVKWIAEKTGYPVTRRTVQAASVRVTESAPNPNPAAAVASLEDAGNPGAVMNRETTFRAWIAGLRNREAGDILAPLEAAAQDPGMSDAQFLQHAQSLIDSIKEIDPQAAEQMAADLDAAMTKAAVEGVKQGASSLPNDQ